MLESSSQPPTGRMLVLLSLVWAANTACLCQAIASFYPSGTSKLLLLLFEVGKNGGVLSCQNTHFVILASCVQVTVIFCDIIRSVLKYILSFYSLKCTSEDRQTYLYYTDLLAEIATLVLTLSHYFHIWTVN